MCRSSTPVCVVADLYRRRWTIETAFAEMEKVLNGEYQCARAGDFEAALFSFCMALVGAECPVHGQGCAVPRCMVRRKVDKAPASYLADEIQCATAGS